MQYTLEGLEQQIQDIKKQYNSLGTQPFYPTQQQNNFTPVPYPIPPSQPQQVHYVEGLNGAKIYQNNLPANASEIIMDKEEDIFYMVSKDANGTPSKKIARGRFTLEELPEEEPAFLTKKDFEDFKEEIRQMFANKTPTEKVISTTKKVTQEAAK